MEITITKTIIQLQPGEITITKTRTQLQPDKLLKLKLKNVGLAT